MKKLSFLKTALVLCVLTFSVSAFAGEPLKNTETVDSTPIEVVIVDTKKDNGKNDKEGEPTMQGMRGVWDG